MKKSLFCFTFIFLFYFSQAQEQLTLLECVNIAIENSLEIEQTEIDYENALLDYEQSRLEQFPSLNANTNHSLNFGRSLDFTTYEFNTQTTQANSFGVNAGATLFAGGRLKENIRLQEMLANRAEVNTDALKDQIAVNVAANFLMAISAKEQIEIAELQVELREQDVERTRKLIELGTTPGAAAYDTEAQLANAQFQLQQAENNYEVAKLQLKQSMLYPFDIDIEVVAPDVPLPTIETLQSELNPEVVYQNALITQNVIQGAEQDIFIAEQNIKIAESQKYPTISINGGANTYHSSVAQEVIGQETLVSEIPLQGYTGPGQTPFFTVTNSVPIQQDASFGTQLGNNFSQNIGIGIQIPIFNRGQINTQIEKAKKSVERSRVQSDIQKRQLRQTIQSAYLDAELAYKAYKAAEKQVELLEKSAEFAKKRYDIGAASIYDYFTTQNNLANARVQLTQAKYDYLYKVKTLEFYKENNFEF